MKLVDIFTNIKTSIVGTKTTKLDSDIDQSLSTISKYTSVINRNNYIELIKNILVSGNEITSDSIIKDNNIANIQFFDRTGRLQRYVEYDSICRNIAHCNRALNVLTDVIISPDDISKRSIMISLSEGYEELYSEDVVEKLKKELENIKKSINLEKHIVKIVRTTLKKGDYFIEILHSPKGENAFTILSESNNSYDVENENTIVLDAASFILKTDRQFVTEDAKTYMGKIIIEAYPNSFTGALSGIEINRPVNMKTQSVPPGNVRFSGDTPHTSIVSKGDSVISDVSKDDFVDDKYFGPDKEESKEGKRQLKDIFITLHNPRYVIRLETERFRSCLGYLVFPKIDPSRFINQSFTVINNDIDSICLNIIRQIRDKIKSNNFDKIDSKELKNAVLTYLTMIDSQEDLKIRYVSPDRMVHFRINVDIYDPYGESIFDCVLFDSKLLMALKTANTIRRLTTSTDKRLITVETGLPHNAKTLIDTIRENMKKRKVSIDKFGSIDTIPSLISTFEDIYIPSRDGKKYVEIDSLRWGGDPQEDIEPLKFIRDNIVANLNLPPAFIGLEENATNRSLLTVESVVFARTIISYQKQFSECLHELFLKIYNLIKIDNKNDDLIEHIVISFSPPKASLYEHTMEYLENASRAITTLREFGIPEDYLQENYLSFLDWDKIESYKIKNSLKKKLSPDEMQGSFPPGSPTEGGFSPGGPEGQMF